MAYTHEDKSSGQVIRSMDWNNMGHEVVNIGREVVRLDTDKVNRAGDTIKGDLSVTGKFGASGDGKFEAALSVGKELKVGGTLNVTGGLAIGTTSAPKNTLDVRGRINVEEGVIQKGGDPITGTKDLGLYSPLQGYWIRLVTNQAPIAFFTDGGFGKNAELSINSGAVTISTGTLNFGSSHRQMINLWGTDQAIGVQSYTQYFRTSGNFAWYQGGKHADGQLDAGGGTVMMSLQNSNLNITGGLSVGGALTVTGASSIGGALTVIGDIQIKGARLRNSQGYGLLEANNTDWLRVNPDSSYSGIALYKPVAIGNGGLAVGSWEQLPVGDVKITGSLTIGSWKFANEGSTLVIRYNGNYVAHFSVGRDRFLVRRNPYAREGDYSAGYFYYNDEGSHN